MTGSDDVSRSTGVWQSSLIGGLVATIEQQCGGLSAVVRLQDRAVGYFDAPTLCDLLKLIEKHRGPGRYEGPSFEATTAEPLPDAPSPCPAASC